MGWYLVRGMTNFPCLHERVFWFRMCHVGVRGPEWPVQGNSTLEGPGSIERSVQGNSSSLTMWWHSLVCCLSLLYSFYLCLWWCTFVIYICYGDLLSWMILGWYTFDSWFCIEVVTVHWLYLWLDSWIYSWFMVEVLVAMFVLVWVLVILDYLIFVISMCYLWGISWLLGFSWL